MSVVIIGGGGGVRNAVTALENASVGMTAAQRAQAVKLFDHVKELLETFTAAPQPPA